MTSGPTSRLLCLLPTLLFSATACDNESSGGTGSVLWVRNLHDTNAEGLRVVVDNLDQITVAAYQTGVVNLSGETDAELGHDDGSTVLLVARYNSSGGPLWSVAFDGTFDSSARIGLAVAANGDVVLGVTEIGGGIDFGDGIRGELTGTSEGFLASFANIDGSLLWARTLLDAPDSVTVADLAIDRDTVYLVGERWLALDTGGEPLATPGNTLFYLEALDLGSGMTIWSRVHGAGASPVAGMRIAVRPDGDLYASGTYLGPLTLGDDLGTVTETTFFLTRLDRNTGEAAWGKSFLHRSGALDISSDSLGAVIVVGDYFLREEDATEAAEGADIPLMTITKYPDFDGAGGGDEVWSWFVGRGMADEQVASSGVDVDGDDNVIVGGEFIGTLIFGTQHLYSDRITSLFVLKMEPLEGNAIWARYSGGTDEVWSADVCTDSLDNVLATGVFEPSTVGSPQPTVQPREIFLLKLAP